MHKRFVLSVFGAALIAGPVLADDLRPGQWQVVQTMEVAGQTLPPQTLTFCHQASDPQTLPNKSMPEGCKADRLVSSGNTVRWQFSCTGENAMQGTGEMTQHADSYEGVMRLKTQAGEMVTHMKGKHIGDC